MRLALVLLLAAVSAWAQPERIISTAPSITEMLYALGLGPKVVGVTTFCRYPADAQSKPKVGTFIQPDYEKILSLKPDVVFIIKNPINLGQRLTQLGVRSIELKQDSIADILHSLRQIGDATGRPRQAAQLASRLEQQLEQLRQSVRGKPPVTTVFVVDRTPGTLQGMFGAGKGSYLDELLTIAGGRNVVSGAAGLYPKLSLEDILTADPEVIIDMGDYSHGRAVSNASSAGKLALWSRYGNLRAVRNRRVYDVSADHFVVAGPRMVEAALEFRRMLHSEVRAQ